MSNDWVTKFIIFGFVWTICGTVVPTLWKGYESRFTRFGDNKRENWSKRLFDCYVYTWLAIGAWGFFFLLLTNIYKGQ